MQLVGSKAFAAIMALGVLGVPLQAQAQSQASTTAYTYDALGRLVQVEKSGGQQGNAARTYEYDRVGNRIAFASSEGKDDDGGSPSQPANLKLLFIGRFVAVAQD